ncbi:MAG: mannose-1-phosphate guanylyltransferase [Melioribacteraceae bacterium]|nr:mannose-1-phosphate guanylyltransferase [Melioribacteraceae bacterium]MCF8264268.1 mannose-1-phosphate guanylyltransferase [Melioribacteraceae bacterium]MCF8413400.1 mannose-1-phosphate guanylyltransferase [Melioribacteraceae bacterium]MCF8431768.1 mannose-1-phosphate guanylyltransferase [Melioribacteraceae bacterium]
MKYYAVIMAGGSGAKFWPITTETQSKQFLKVFNSETLIEETIGRLEGLIPNDQIIIVTTENQYKAILRVASTIPKENILVEPFAKNTAAAIGYASVVIKTRCEDAVIFNLPADHYVDSIDKFQESLKCAAAAAENHNGLITIGIHPDYPEDSFGYLQFDDEIEDGVFKVLKFAEKPNLSTAERFVKAGDFLWNSGIFVWKLSVILNQLEENLPELFTGLTKIEGALNDPKFEYFLLSSYGQFRNLSIDYGLMEKSDIVYTVKGNFKWSDIGSWETVFNLLEKDGNGNSLHGKVYTDDVQNSYIRSNEKVAAVIGVDNLIVINHKRGLLICSMEKAEEVKEIVDFLKIHKFN